MKFFAQALSAACLAAWLAALAPARAQEASSADNPLGALFDGAKLRADPPPMADFVINSRPDASSLDYSPLSTPEPGRGAKKKTPAEIEAVMSELANAAAANRRRAARVKIPEPGATAPATAKTHTSPARPN
ncbi:MAG: hypothetical protein HYS06_01215 [Methylocystis sp.]|nr:hypothetical protein [Methylocystis sp.]MBI3275301.1 hypothetical protein [Methylocystis sp.]